MLDEEETIVAAAPVVASPALAPEPEELSEDEETVLGPRFEFDEAFQRKVVALTMRDGNFAARTQGLIKPEYFTNEGLGAIVAVLNDYTATYKELPSLTTVPTLLKNAFASKKIRADVKPLVLEQMRALLKGVDLSGASFVVDQVARFARHQALEAAVLHSAELLLAGKDDQIAGLMRTAADVGAADDNGGYDYWGEIENRTLHRLDKVAGIIKPTGITTGFKELDAYLYNSGWGRKELSVLMAAAKKGKSMGLGQFALAASLAGYNALYCTCEVGTRILADRFDANAGDTPMRELDTKVHGVAANVKAKRANAGKLIVHEFASGQLKASQLRRMLKRYRGLGIIFDLIVVDYADIMAPERKLEDIRHESTEIFVDLRAIGFEENAAMLTATQTNRTGAGSMIARATDVAEDYGKIRTADITISINATPEEMAQGEARLFFAASRNEEGEICLRVRQDRGKMQFITKVLGLA